MLVTNTYTDSPVLAGLSSKQREVLDLVVDRRTNKEISVILGISPSAVEQRLQSVRRKFDVQGRADLARAYLRFLEACENLTGEEKQVSEGADLSTFVKERFSPVGDQGSDLGQSGLRDQPASPAMNGAGVDIIQQQSVLDRLDAAAGLSGRIAAIVTTAAAFAFLMVLMTSASQAMN